MTYYLAIDIGASSGRHILSHIENGKLVLEEIYRFDNNLTQSKDGLVLDIESLFSEVLNGIKKCKEMGKIPKSIAIDTCGVDYVLLDENKKEIKPCFCYRDSRTNAVVDEVESLVSPARLYAKTGIQKQNLNTIYQLYADKKNGRLLNAKYFLMMPEYLSFKLTGACKNEYTNATTTAELLWGYADGGKFTSELPAHLMSHMARLSVDPENRVIMHSHPTNMLAMNYVHPLDEKQFTHTLWEMCTECIVVFPDGIGVLPWMLCGTNEIGMATAEKMKEFRLVVWGMHGIYGAGKTMDETFGLIETVEKAAQIYMLTAHLPRVNTIKDSKMKELAEFFGVDYRKDFLNIKE